MATIEQRLSALEKAINNAPMLVMTVTDHPTEAQQAEIGRATQTGHRTLVFYMPDDMAWMPGCGLPPWCEQEGGDRA